MLCWLIFSYFVVHVSSFSLPSYIKQCSLSSPDFNDCCLQHAKAAVPHIVKGDRKYNIPNLSPLVLPKFEVMAGNNLKISMTDLHVHGLEHTEVLVATIAIDKQTIYIKIAVPSLQLIGKYEIEGQILVLPISGKGNINITAVNGKYEYDVKYKLETRGGEEYIAMESDDLKYELEQAYIHFANLFNGDDNLGNTMNQFLNDNWQEVNKEIGGPIREAIKIIIRTIADGYFHKIPYKTVFLP